MPKSQFKKLEFEQKKDDTCYISPEKTHKPRKNTQSWGLTTIAELIKCMEWVDLNNKEILCFVMTKVLGWQNRELSRIAKDINCHTTINKYTKLAKKKMESISDLLTQKLQDREPAKEEELETWTEEIEEMFEKHKNHRKEKSDRRRAPKCEKKDREINVKFPRKYR